MREIADTEPELLGVRKRDKILVILPVGAGEAKEAADKLIKMGYSQVYDFGGTSTGLMETVKEE